MWSILESIPRALEKNFDGSPVALLIFYLDDMPIDISGVLKFSTVIVLLLLFYVCLMLTLFI